MEIYSNHKNPIQHSYEPVHKEKHEPKGLSGIIDKVYEIVKAIFETISCTPSPKASAPVGKKLSPSPSFEDFKRIKVTSAAILQIGDLEEVSPWYRDSSGESDKEGDNKEEEFFINNRQEESDFLYGESETEPELESWQEPLVFPSKEASDLFQLEVKKQEIGFMPDYILSSVKNRIDITLPPEEIKEKFKSATSKEKKVLLHDLLVANAKTPQTETLGELAAELYIKMDLYERDDFYGYLTEDSFQGRHFLRLFAQAMQSNMVRHQALEQKQKGGSGMSESELIQEKAWR